MSQPTVSTHAYELHMSTPVADSGGGESGFPWAPQEHEVSPPTHFEVASGVVWLGRSQCGQTLSVVDDFHEALAGFRTIHRRHGHCLAMLTNRKDVLVNGRRALPLSILTVKDSVVLGTGLQMYVTERVRPYHGRPLEHLISKVCPFCRLAFTPETTLVQCRCGTAYHLEPKPSSPEDSAEDDDVLRCFERVKKCLSCGRDLTLKEYLEWNPRSPW